MIKLCDSTLKIVMEGVQIKQRLGVEIKGSAANVHHSFKLEQDLTFDVKKDCVVLDVSSEFGGFVEVVMLRGEDRKRQSELLAIVEFESKEFEYNNSLACGVGLTVPPTNFRAATVSGDFIDKNLKPLIADSKIAKHVIENGCLFYLKENYIANYSKAAEIDILTLSPIKTRMDNFKTVLNLHYVLRDKMGNLLTQGYYNGVCKALSGYLCPMADQNSQKLFEEAGLLEENHMVDGDILKSIKGCAIEFSLRRAGDTHNIIVHLRFEESMLTKENTEKLAELTTGNGTK
jgi:hypothetical protein